MVHLNIIFSRCEYHFVLLAKLINEAKLAASADETDTDASGSMLGSACSQDDTEASYGSHDDDVVKKSV